MTFHLVALPHTQTTKAYSACAYTQKVVKFANMMTERGHKVYLYSSEDNDAKCTEHIVCITKKQQAESGFKGPADYIKIEWDATKPYFETMNQNTIREIKKRIKPKDFILLTTSWPNQPIFEAFPHPQFQVVEYGIGYKGTMSKYLVFESHAWRNFVYGRGDSEGNFFHEVIPNYFEIKDFPFSAKKDDYFLFVGRLNEDKGLSIAVEVCKKLGKRLILAGAGTPPAYGEYRGIVEPKERGQLMSKAQAIFVPSLYVEPFGGVHVEAMLCGTPVITTDWGVFTETVINGFNGYRCKMFRDFVAASEKVDQLDYKAIRGDAIKKYSTKVVAKQYEDYFKRLLTLWTDGWYA